MKEKQKQAETAERDRFPVYLESVPQGQTGTCLFGNWVQGTFKYNLYGRLLARCIGRLGRLRWGTQPRFHIS